MPNSSQGKILITKQSGQKRFREEDDPGWEGVMQLHLRFEGVAMVAMRCHFELYPKGNYLFVNYNNRKMGNTETIPFSKCAAGKSKLQNYEFIRRLGEGKAVMRNKLTKKYAVVLEHTFPSEEQLNEYMKRHKNNFSLTHQFYLNAFDCEIITQANLCSKQFRLAQYFEHQSHTLLSEIEGRTDHQRHFSSKEFMSILCSCVLAMSYFNKNQILHYTLGPEDIVIDEEGICKILSSSLSNNQFDFNQKKDFYYAPESMRMFKQQALASGLTNKSGVFTLGITLLHMAHLRDMRHLYNFNSFSINFDLLAQEVRKVSDSNIQSIIKKMVKPQTYDRISFTELQEMLFEVIAKSDKSMQLPKEAYYQSEHYQINKLQESILRLKNEETSQSSVSNNTKTDPYRETPPPLPYPTLSKDDEDQPESDRNHMILTQEDNIVLDEFEQPIGIDYSQTTRNMITNKSMKSSNHLLYQEKMANSQRVLSECSHFYNNTYNLNAGSIYRHSETQREEKENLIHFQYSSKKKDIDEYPEYVSEVLKEGRYEGYKLGQYRHGFGTFYYNEGGKYCGEWVKNRMEGRGVLYYASGKIAYEGEWKQDRLDGYGVLYNESIGILREEYDCSHLELLNDEWIKYEGCFKDDVKEGQGTLYLSNGESYRGEFENDQPHGKGQFKNIRGEGVVGFWLMGALNIVQ